MLRCQYNISMQHAWTTECGFIFNCISATVAHSNKFQGHRQIRLFGCILALSLDIWKPHSYCSILALSSKSQGPHAALWLWLLVARNPTAPHLFLDNSLNYCPSQPQWLPLPMRLQKTCCLYRLFQ